jgi:hypothetical protein
MSPDVRSPLPPAPRTLEAAGLPADLVQQMILKTLHIGGDITGNELASRLGVVFGVLQPGVDLLKKERLCEIAGAAIGPQSYTYRLTDAGHSRASASMSRSSYVGQLPVPLSQYTAYMNALDSAAGSPVTRQAVRKAFSHLVLSDRMLDQLGPGIASRHSLFVYGPSGNGKTVIARAIGHLLGDDIAIPYALSVGGEIIQLYDPLNHNAREAGDPEPGIPFLRDVSDDGRWIRCRRPVITVGGELRLDYLELGHSPVSGLYRAPIQMVANGGVLIIDDFGRQRSSPREMLNRWIVPLESRTDHLVLQTGQKFEVPFDALIVFATNLNPIELLDESFLRRIRYKVYAQSPTKQEFSRIFENYCREQRLRFDPLIVETLITDELEPRGVELRGCHPRDLIDHALALAKYTDQPNILTNELLSAACGTYFLAEMRKTSVEH